MVIAIEDVASAEPSHRFREQHGQGVQSLSIWSSEKSIHSVRAREHPNCLRKGRLTVLQFEGHS